MQMVGGSLDAGHPYAGKLRQASILLPKGMDGQKMKIRAEIETKGGIRRAVNWASAQSSNPGRLTHDPVASSRRRQMEQRRVKRK